MFAWGDQGLGRLGFDLREPDPLRSGYKASRHTNDSGSDSSDSSSEDSEDSNASEWTKLSANLLIAKHAASAVVAIQCRICEGFGGST